MTLLEVVIAMLLLSLLALGMSAVFNLVGKGPGRLGVLELQALNFARETLDVLKNNVSAVPARSAPLNAPAHVVDPLPAGDLLDHNGSRTYDVADIDMDGDGNVDGKRVTVSVQWDDD